MLDLVNIREPRGFEDRVEAAVAPNSPSEFLSNLLAEHEDDVALKLRRIIRKQARSPGK